MTEAIALTEKYFELSNQHDMTAIAELFTESSTYSSVNTGVYLGRTQIMAMMEPFHASFSELSWNINTITEIRPGVVEIKFTMIGTKETGEHIKMTGTEYVIVHNYKLQHVEVRNK